MRIAVDTNRYADLVAGSPDAIEVISRADEVIVPFAVLAELHSGFRGGGRRAANEATLARFLAKPGTSAMYADSDTADVWATLAFDLRRRGRAVPHNDVWIAALCLQHGLRLYTRDRHFDALPQVLRA